VFTVGSRQAQEVYK